MGNTLVLVDGDHNLHRILHVPVFQEMTTAGNLTGGAFGALTAIKNACDQFGASQCVVVWDHGKSDFRCGLFDGYKSGRESDDPIKIEEKKRHRRMFQSQKTLLLPMLKYLGVRSIQMEGVEGDDLIYAISTKLFDEMGLRRCVIVSEDMDLAQLVSDKVKMYRPGKRETLGVDEVEARANVPLQHYVLKKAMMGDTSDSIPGVKGVGDKTAAAVIEECAPGGILHSLEELASWAECQSKKAVQRISTDIEVVMRNMELMDLSQFPWTEPLLESVRAGITAPIAKDLNSARKCFEVLKFASILLSYTSWTMPFKRLR